MHAIAKNAGRFTYQNTVELNPTHQTSKYSFPSEFLTKHFSNKGGKGLYGANFSIIEARAFLNFGQPKFTIFKWVKWANMLIFKPI